MKRLMNLLMLVILIYTVSVMPINTVVFGIDFSRILAPVESDDNTPQDAGLKTAFTGVNPGDLRIAPVNYTVHLDTSKTMAPDALKELLQVQLTLTDTLGHKTSWTEEDLSYEITPQENRYTIHLNIAQSSLGTAFDEYSAQLKLQIQSEEYTDQFSILYTPESISPNGMSASDIDLTLAPYFFTDNSEQHSIPIFTPTLPGNNPYRRMINTLNQAPKATFLAQTPAFPPVRYIWYSAGLLELRLNSADLSAFSTRESAEVAMENLLNTARLFSRETVINKVRITVDGGQTSQAFGTLALDREFIVERSPITYIPLLTDSGLIWLPKSVQNSEDLTSTARLLLTGLKAPHTLINDSRALAIMPSEIELLQATLVNNTLRLSFNDALTTTYGDRPELIATMLEGLSLSMSTIPDVNSLELYIGDSRVTAIGSVGIPEHLKRPDYFNVLK